KRSSCIKQSLPLLSARTRKLTGSRLEGFCRKLGRSPCRIRLLDQSSNLSHLLVTKGTNCRTDPLLEQIETTRLLAKRYCLLLRIRLRKRTFENRQPSSVIPAQTRKILYVRRGRFPWYSLQSPRNLGAPLPKRLVDGGICCISLLLSDSPRLNRIARGNQTVKDVQSVRTVSEIPLVIDVCTSTMRIENRDL